MNETQPVVFEPETAPIPGWRISSLLEVKDKARNPGPVSLDYHSWHLLFGPICLRLGTLRGQRLGPAVGPRAL